MSGAITGLITFVGKKSVKEVKQADKCKFHAEELNKVKVEQCLLCYGVLGCLEGLIQLGCNNNVTTMKDKIEKHLNQLAHE